MTELPPTRWEQAGRAGPSGYGAFFAQQVEQGADIDGEARLADAMCPRGARILDVGSGMGRVAEALRLRGHTVVATEPDPELAEQSRRTYPDLEVLPHQALTIPDEVGRFDLVVVVGNVMVYLAEGTERAVLAHLGRLLAPGGRMLLGFELVATKRGARSYPPDEFVSDVAAAGLRVVHRFGTFELHEPDDDFAVWVLAG